MIYDNKGNYKCFDYRHLSLCPVGKQKKIMNLTHGLVFANLNKSFLSLILTQGFDRNPKSSHDENGLTFANCRS